MLDVQNLTIEYTTAAGPLRAVEDVSFTLQRGESLGIVGESGCGKTTATRALLRLLPKNGAITAGRILFDGDDLVRKSDAEIRRLRHRHIALISQSAMNALNPVYTVGEQIKEGIRAHTRMSDQEARARCVEVFGLVGLEAKRLDSYPHQLSGGMKQRAVIAMALSLEPEIIVADEPTTALDVVVQGRILQRLRQIRERISSSMIFITHDISVVGESCETIIVMYGGRIMERADTRSFFRTPTHPYSMGLQNAFPSIADIGHADLVSIPGSPPDLLAPQPGCRFRARCPFADADVCQTRTPPLLQVADRHWAACWYTDQAAGFRARARDHATWRKAAADGR